MNNQSTDWEQLSKDEKKIRLFGEQKKLLDLFLENGSITKAQYNHSLTGLKDKMNIDNA